MRVLRETLSLALFGTILTLLSGCVVADPRLDAADQIKPRLQEGIEEIRNVTSRKDTTPELSTLITLATDLRDPAIRTGDGSLGYYELQDIDGNVMVALIASASVDDPETTIGTDTYFACVELHGERGTLTFEIDVRECPEWVLESYGYNDYYELSADYLDL